MSHKDPDVRRLIKKMGRMEVGGFISYETLSSLIDFPITEPTGYGIFMKARSVLRGRGIYFKAIYLMGYERISNEEILTHIQRKNEIINLHSVENNQTLNMLKLDSPEAIDRFNKVKTQTALIAGVSDENKFDRLYETITNKIEKFGIKDLLQLVA